MVRQNRIISICILAALLLIGLAAAYQLEETWLAPEQLAERLRGFGAWTPLAVIALMIIHSFVPFPAEILALCAGAIFGTLMGAALIWVGAMLGAVLAFGLARTLGQAAIRSWLSERQAGQLDAWMDKQGATTLLVSRFIPLIAFNLINYAAGLSPVRGWTFLWTTAIGILPVTFLSTYLGAQMKGLSWPVLLGVSAAGIAVVLGLHRVARTRGWI